MEQEKLCDEASRQKFIGETYFKSSWRWVRLLSFDKLLIVFQTTTRPHKLGWPENLEDVKAIKRNERFIVASRVYMLLPGKRLLDIDCRTAGCQKLMKKTWIITKHEET